MSIEKGTIRIEGSVRSHSPMAEAMRVQHRIEHARRPGRAAPEDRNVHIAIDAIMFEDLATSPQFVRSLIAVMVESLEVIRGRVTEPQVENDDDVRPNWQRLNVDDLPAVDGLLKFRRRIEEIDI